VICTAGSSEAARDLAAKHADYYLMLAEDPAVVAATIADVRARAAAYGRADAIRFGLSVDVILRETDEEAFAEAKRVFDSGIAAATVQIAAERTGQMSETHQSRYRRYLGRAINGYEDLFVAPNLWAGFQLCRHSARLRLRGQLCLGGGPGARIRRAGHQQVLHQRLSPSGGDLSTGRASPAALPQRRTARRRQRPSARAAGHRPCHQRQQLSAVFHDISDRKRLFMTLQLVTEPASSSLPDLAHAPARRLSSEAEAIAAAHEVADAIAHITRNHDREVELPIGQLRLLSESGVTAIAVPRELGGLGASIETITETVRIISQVDGGVGQILQLHNVMIGGILASPDEAYRAFFAPRILAGERFGNALAEVGARTSWTCAPP
jgi:hypothetical protein